MHAQNMDIIVRAKLHRNMSLKHVVNQLKYISILFLPKNYLKRQIYHRPDRSIKGNVLKRKKIQEVYLFRNLFIDKWSHKMCAILK